MVGRNGSGKSTLLKLLAGTMRPTSGQITARGRVFGLLELAAGFHPELSGRDNVFLNGAFLGLSRRHMAERFDQIVAFAELEQFIDTPVKHYSSGMYMRLGFAIAISVEPDILVIDEVLAVGDAAFRQKCFAALADLKQRQKTILFVTHDASAVRRFCDEAIWLDRGYVRAAGPAPDVLSEYLAATGATHGQALTVAGRPADPLALPRGPVTILGVETVTESGAPERHFVPGERIGVRVRFRAARDVPQLSLGIGLHRADGLYLSGTSSAAGGHQGRSGAGRGGGHLLARPPPPRGRGVHRLGRRLDGGRPRPATASPRPPASPSAPPAGSRAGPWCSRPPGRPGAPSPSPPPRTVDDDTLRERPAGFRAGDAADQARPVGAFQARWRRPPSRLKMGEGDEEFLGPGWYPPEDWPPCVRWTTRRAVAYLTQDEWTSSVGVTMCRPRHEATVPTGRVLVDGRLAGRFELTVPALEPFHFPLEPVSGAREVEVVLEIDVPVEPASGGRATTGGSSASPSTSYGWSSPLTPQPPRGRCRSCRCWSSTGTGRRLLPRCLDALSRTDYPQGRWEAVLVDNASTDGSLESALVSYPWVVPWRNPANWGFARGYLAPMAASPGPYVVLLNSDTQVTPGLAAGPGRRRGGRSHAGGGDGQAGLPPAQPPRRAHPERRGRAPAGRQRARPGHAGAGRAGGARAGRGAVRPPGGGLLLLRRRRPACARRRWRTPGGFDPRYFMYYEDLDLSWRLRLRGWKVVYVPTALVEHDHAASSGEWSPFFRFHVERNRPLMLLKLAPWSLAATGGGALPGRAGARTPPGCWGGPSPGASGGPTPRTPGCRPGWC